MLKFFKRSKSKPLKNPKILIKLKEFFFIFIRCGLWNQKGVEMLKLSVIVQI